MNATQLAANLRDWYREFRSFSDCTADVPDQFWRFLANRIAEQGAVTEDVGVVTVNTSVGPRKLRVIGTSPGGRIMGEPTDGSRGFALFEKGDVIPEDVGKLSAAMENLLTQGKVKEAAR